MEKVLGKSSVVLTATHLGSSVFLTGIMYLDLYDQV